MQSDQNPYRIRDLPSPKPLLLLQPPQVLGLQPLAGKQQRDSWRVRTDQLGGNTTSGLIQRDFF